MIPASGAPPTFLSTHTDAAGQQTLTATGTQVPRAKEVHGALDDLRGHGSPGSVSFATLEPGGPVTVTVSLSEGPLAMTTTPERAILVPFSIAGIGNVEIASITDSASVQLAVGEYALTYQHGRGADGHMWVAFTFELAAFPVRPELLRADAALRPPPVLLMAADPA